MPQEFAHLHVHTEYSLLDGFSRIKKLVHETVDKGMKHLAVTDHGTMYGVPEFYKECKAQGVHGVIGVEAYLADDIMNKTHRGKEDYSHLLLLARNNTGYRNLMRLTTIANTKGVHGGKPRIDRALLEQYSEGLVGTSTCVAGEVPQMILRGNMDEARKAVQYYREVFGSHYYLELQEHHGHGSPQREVNKGLYTLHRELGVPLVVTNDVHYVSDADAGTHDILLCVQTGKQRKEEKRLKFDSEEYFLRSPDQMEHLFPNLLDALANSVRIAEMCEVDPFAYRASLPVFQVPEAYTSQADYLLALCKQGAMERFGQITDPIRDQLEYEWRIICEKGFASYFLIEWDFVNYARSRGIRCLARGSAAGSLLAYTLGITNVDPLSFGLLFERFFNPARSDMPDIDMDFPDERREEVIEYVVQKYGLDCVAQMVTFNTMAAKNSVKDVARVLGQQSLGDRITRLIGASPKGTLKGALASQRDMARLYEKDRGAREIIDQALLLEGSIRSTGTHAAGVVIGNEALENFVPLRSKDYKNPGAGRETMYEQKYLEELGLIKFDFLGLSNLTILDNTLKYIKATRGEDIDLERLPLDELPASAHNAEEQNRKRKKAFELLANGETTGLFQLEGARMSEYIRQLGPTCIQDIMAMIALYRPGPMDSIREFIAAKHGRKAITYLDDRLAEWLDESYGVIVFQDQVLQIAFNLAGFDWDKVNKFRKALSKKLMDEVESYRAPFVAGCVKNGLKSRDAQRLFTLILPFGGYGFNKAHAASYAVVAFYTAYLKANYTAEFMAATMTTEAADPKKIAKAVAECRRMGVEVFGPDINASQQDFTIERGGIRFGLLAIKGIGEGPIGAILQARQEGGAFKTLGDFCARIDARAGGKNVAGKSVIETFIKVGAMDCLGDGTIGSRPALLASVESAIKYGKSERRAQELGMMSLFAEVESVSTAIPFQLASSTPAMSRADLLDYEKDLLGVYLSRHPLYYLMDVIQEYVACNIAELGEDLVGEKVTLCGIVADIQPLTTKNAETMCVARLEDIYGGINITVFPRLYGRTTALWQDRKVVLITGEIQIRNDELILVCDEAEQFDGEGGAVNRKQYDIWITFHRSGTDDLAVEADKARLQNLYAIIHRPGKDRFHLQVENSEWEAHLKPEENTTHYSQEMHEKLVDALGDLGEIKVTAIER